MRREIGGELRQDRRRPANSPLWAEAHSPACSPALWEAIYPLPNARQAGLPNIAGKRWHMRAVGPMLSTAPRASRSTKLLARVETRKSCTAPLHSDFSNSSGSC